MIDTDPAAYVEALRQRIAADTDRPDAEAMIQAARAADLRAVLGPWAVPLRVLDTMPTLQETPLTLAVDQWALTKSWCLVLSASKGAGKSTAAGAWLSSHAANVSPGPGLKRHWWTGVQLARLDIYTRALDVICGLASLVIDDLGVEFLDTKGALQQRLDCILDERYGNYRKTIITTNLSALHFKERYGERIADRIREDGKFMEFSDGSRR